MNQLVVAKRYASALFKLVEKDLPQAEKILEILENIHDLSKDPHIRGVLTSPVVKPETKQLIFSDILKKLQAPPTLENFFGELIQSSRVGVVPHLYPVFKELFNQLKGVVDGEIYTVVPLEEKDLERIKSAYQAKLGKKLNLKQIIDPSILGGLKLKVKNQLIDLSLKTELDQIAQTAVS